MYSLNTKLLESCTQTRHSVGIFPIDETLIRKYCSMFKQMSCYIGQGVHQTNSFRILWLLKVTFCSNYGFNNVIKI